MNTLKKKVSALLVAISFALVMPAHGSMCKIDQELHIAVSSNNFADVRALVENKGADVNTVDGYGYTPLNRAVVINNIALVKFLVEKGADVNFTYVSGYTYSPLYLAARTGNFEIVKYLVENGADVKKESMGGGVLHPVASRGDVPMVAYLIKNGADIHATEGDRAQPALTFAKDMAMVTFLVENGANINYPVRPLLSQMVTSLEDDRLQRANYFLKNGANVNIQYIGVTPLMTAAWKGDVVFVKLFLSYDADPYIKDKEGKMAIYYVQKGFKRYGPEKVAQYKEIIRLLAVAMNDSVLQKRHEEMIEKQLGWFYKLKRRLQSFFGGTR